MRSNLEARIERLEASQRPTLPTVYHRIIQQVGQSSEEARSLYERESGLVIEPEDFVIVRVLVAPVDRSLQ